MIHHAKEIFTEGEIAALAITRDGSQIAVATEEAIDLIDLASGTKLVRIRSDHKATDLSFSSDERLLAVAMGQPTVFVYDCTSGRLVHKLIRNTVPDFLRTQAQVQLEFVPNSSTLIVRGEDTVLTVWNCKSGQWENLYRMPHGNGVFETSPDARQIAIVSKPNPNAYRGQVSMYRLHQGFQPIWNRSHESEEAVSYAAFSPNSSRLATCGASDGIRIWSVESGELLGHIEDPQPNRFQFVEFAGDEHHLLTVPSRNIELRHAQKSEVLTSVASRQPGDFRGFQTANNGRTIVTFNSNAAVDVWKAELTPQTQN